VRGSGSDFDFFDPGLMYQPRIPAAQTRAMAVVLKRMV
jgi:hypothetical protein